MEAEAPPQVAQSLGLVFAVLGGIGYPAGITPLGMAVATAALVAAFLNAAFGFCLGCETYLLIKDPARFPGDGKTEPDRRLLYESSSRPRGPRLGGGGQA